MSSVYEYDVLIRSFNSSATLPRVIQSLSAQDVLPSRIIVIDSGSTDDTKSLALSAGCEVQDYIGDKFSYSCSLNQGLSLVRAPLVLVLSSHAVLGRNDAVSRLWRALADRHVAASYWEYVRTDEDVVLVTRDTFNGLNGLWNVCALYRTEIVKDFGFDEAVPSCEDQHLAMRLYAAGYITAAVGGQGLGYQNEHVNRRKKRNEYIATAAFIVPSKLRMGSIGRIGLAGCKALVAGKWCDAGDRFILFMRLVWARVRRPVFSSRYFTV